MTVFVIAVLKFTPIVLVANLLLDLAREVFYENPIDKNKEKSQLSFLQSIQKDLKS